MTHDPTTGDRCARCGELGNDRRTIWMACFYDMDELGIPFEKKFLFHADIETLKLANQPAGITLKDGVKINLQSATFTTDGEIRPHEMYTVFVCKSCRSDWLAAQRAWFNSSRTPEGDGDIPVRINGAVRMLTREEWEARRAKKGPNA